MKTGQPMRLIRRLHRWLGVFFAPSIVFFALSGVIQLFEWHEGGPGAPASPWLVKLAEVHRIQSVDDLPERRPRPPAARRDDDLGVDRAAAAQPTPPRPTIHRSAALRWFFSIMALGLIASTVLGVVMALSLRQQRPLIGGLLAAGTVVPLLLLLW